MAKRRTTEQPGESGAEPAPQQQAGRIAGTLAQARLERMGAEVGERFAKLGARWLADPMPGRLDAALVERLSRQGFRRERLADIRVHRGAKAQAAADALDARAFAVGDTDVFFGAGQYDPATAEGRAVIAHEVAHVAPPSGPPGAGGATAAAHGPALNERRRGRDASDGEAEERAARQAEARVFAEESTPTAADLPVAPQPSAQAPSRPARGRVDPHALEAKVMAILARLQRTESERAGQF